MKNHLSLVFEKHDYPLEARKYLLNCTDILIQNKKFVDLVNRFYKNGLLGKDIYPVLDEVAKESGVNEHTVSFLYYLCVTKELRVEYKKRGIAEEIYWDSVNDFRYKMEKGMAILGVWGFHQSAWFYPFLRMTQFKLGRLEFTMNDNYWTGEYDAFGFKLTHGMPIVHVHIPSSKEPFTKEACYDSYDKAYHFFKEVMKYDFVCFCCGSWLLFPKNKEILKAGSNIVRFLDDFKIVDVVIYENQREDLWRIFASDADLPYDKLPKNNSLQKAYAEYLCSGGLVGEGLGIFKWDPELKKPITE